MTTELEPGGERLDCGLSMTERQNVKSLRSIAISLKRIADALHVTNEYGEGPAEAIGAGIARALRQHS